MTEQRVIDIIIVGGAVIGASVHFLRATRTTVKGGTFVLLRQGCYCDVRSIVNSCSACLISLVKKIIDARICQPLKTDDVFGVISDKSILLPNRRYG